MDDRDWRVTARTGAVLRLESCREFPGEVALLEGLDQALTGSTRKRAERLNVLKSVQVAYFATVLGP